ncbi:MAG TPA: hypothetical protein VN446_03135 [Candidatus Acidoferrum sp.]|nr:hypothetical protein [Candidatus Acidoferrum sp.]
MPKSFYCPRCSGNRCQPIVETRTTGKDYSAGKGCCGWLVFGPAGLLCGLCGEGKVTESKTYWMCPDCGHKFRA